MARAPIFYVTILMILVAVIAFWAGGQNWLNGGKKAEISQSGSWVAVTLDNGLIYFGEIRNEQNQYVILNNAYFAQKNASADADKKTSTEGNDYSLVPVGKTEIYGPESSMKINRDHILLIQKLKPDSNVLKAVKAQTTPNTYSSTNNNSNSNSIDINP